MDLVSRFFKCFILTMRNVNPITGVNLGTLDQVLY